MIRRRIFKRLVKDTLIVCLIFSWLFTGFPPVWLPEKTSTGEWQLKQTRIMKVANADTAGPNTPDVIAGVASGACTDNMAWVTTDQTALDTDDTTYISYSAGLWDSGNVTDELRISNFNFALVGGVTSIDGFQVEILGWTPSGAPAASYHTVTLFTAPGSNRGDNKATGTFPIADPGSTYQMFGGASDDWYPAAAWTQAEVESSQFGVALCLTANEANATVNVDVVRITITYTVSAASPTYTQNDFEWFVSADSVTLTDAWPSGSVDLIENEVFTQLPATNRSLVSGDQIRIQMNITVGTANLGIGAQAFQLEYTAGEDCTTAGGWASVGAKASGTIWRLFNTTLGDSATDVFQISTTSNSEYYSETNPTPVNQATTVIGESMEWDWPVENNGAAENTTYCFRMAKSGGAALDTYNSDSYPKLTTAPGTSVLMRHGNFFQNDSEKGFFWAH